MSPSLIWKQFAKSHFYCFPSFIHKKLVRPMSDKSPKRVFCFVFCFAAIKVKLGTGVSRCPIPSSPAGCPVPTLRLLLCHNIVNRKSVWVILWLRNTYCFLLYLKQYYNDQELPFHLCDLLHFFCPKMHCPEHVCIPLYPQYYSVGKQRSVQCTVSVVCVDIT